MSTACCLSAMTESGAASMTRRTQRISPAAPTAWRDTRRLWDMTAGWSFFATGRKRIWPFPSGSGYRTEPDLKPTDKANPAALLFFLPFFTFRDAPQTVSGQLPSRRAQDPSCGSALHRGNVLQHSGCYSSCPSPPSPRTSTAGSQSFPIPSQEQHFFGTVLCFLVFRFPLQQPFSPQYSTVIRQYFSIQFYIFQDFRDFIPHNSAIILMNADYLLERRSIL